MMITVIKMCFRDKSEVIEIQSDSWAVNWNSVIQHMHNGNGRWQTTVWPMILLTAMAKLTMGLIT
jgi:hypothetical protein